MISFDDDSDEEEEEVVVPTDTASVEKYPKASNSIDDFFGITEPSDSHTTAAYTSKQSPPDKPTKKSDDLLDLLSDMNVSSTPNTSNTGQSNLVPPMHAKNMTSSSGKATTESNPSQQPPQWNNEMDPQALYSNLQGMLIYCNKYVT